MIILFTLFPGQAKAEDEQRSGSQPTFWEWYEENKNTDGAQYKLTQNVDTSTKPGGGAAVLDGTGKITIDCGQYSIDARSRLIIDNPNLTLTGYRFAIIVGASDKADISLINGTFNTDKDGAAIALLYGKLSSEGKNGEVNIHKKGTGSAIILNSTSDSVISGFNITAEGTGTTGTVKGIYQYPNSRLELKDCTIQAKGDNSVYGVESNGPVTVNGCKITAVSSQGEDYAYSVSSPKLHTIDSILVPAIREDEKDQYLIYDFDSPEPVYYQKKDGPIPNLPDAVNVYAENKKTGEDLTAPIPVKWDIDSWEYKDKSCHIIKGTFATAGLQGIYETASTVEPSVTVFTSEDSRTFLISHQIRDKEDDYKGIQLMIPYPYGAEEMTLQYSSDGTTYHDYTQYGDTNIFNPYDPYPQNWIYGFMVRPPFTTNTIYIRVTIDQGVYAGQSDIWTIYRDSQQVIPPDLSGDNGGDRGGQTLDPGTESPPHPPAGPGSTNNTQTNSESHQSGQQGYTDQTKQTWESTQQPSKHNNNPPSSTNQQPSQQKTNTPSPSTKDQAKETYSQKETKHPPKQNTPNHLIPYAAAVLIIIVILLFTLHHKTHKPHQ